MKKLTRTDRLMVVLCLSAAAFAVYVLYAATPDAATAVEMRWFAATKLRNVREFPDRFQLLEYALQNVKTSGLYCEFGVFKGESINFIAARKPHTTIHGFDSFEGLPEQWRDGYPKGFFRLPGFPLVRANVALYKGWFSDSLPNWAREHAGPVAFAHMDADLYSSTADVFRVIGDRFVAGSVIAFDELIGYPGWRQGEYRALSELAAARQLRYECLGYSGQRVSIRVTHTQRK